MTLQTHIKQIINLEVAHDTNLVYKFMKTRLLSLLAILFMGFTFVNCSSDDDDEVESTIKVSPSVELLGTANSTTTITVSVPQNTTWTVSEVPEWLSLNKSGLGTSSVTVTAISENFSDEVRVASLVFTTDDGKANATCTVEQKGVLAANCRVTVGDMTVMCDGFAADLMFDENCKGYREAFLYASALDNLTDKDIYNLLMEKTELSGTADYTYSPIVASGTEIVYCIAAYGSENNNDGSHKYGPMTIKRITTRDLTLGSDMYLTSSYTSDYWKVVTSRVGKYGQKCDQYYYYGTQGDDAETLYNMVSYFPYAFLAHFFLKPIIENDPEDYKTGPQTITYIRTDDKFFLVTWGVDRNTKEFSSSLPYCYRDLTSNSNSVVSRNICKKVSADSTTQRKYRTKADLPKIGKIICSNEPID